ncbi:MAG: gliding motility-associated C-terminal domain-containing protein [Bacteroidia bacterium]
MLHSPTHKAISPTPDRMIRWRQLLLVIALIFSFTHSQASHLVGGSMSYEYVGRSGSEFVYRIHLDMYRDCFNSTTPFDPVLSVGIYLNNGSRNLFRVKSMSLKSEKSVDPPAGGSNCAFQPDVCLRQGIYTDTIILPASALGYHLSHVRCCRNDLTNLPQMGQTYYSFIPPTTLQNSSPVFTGIPAPFICINDEIALGNQATDPDGDSLVYEISWPLDGGTALDPAPSPSDILPSPLPKVSYNPGYSLSNPLGVSGSSSIDPVTGITTVRVPTQGLYALAIEVKEYRDGEYLGSTIRDVQIIAITCPPNPTPKLIAETGSPVTNYTIQAGELLEFDITVSDTDSVVINYSGSIFEIGEIPPPLATLNNLRGKDTLSSRFRWQTNCSHGRSAPYFFSAQATDKGCPSKTLNIRYTITVEQYYPPNQIEGPDSICEFKKNARYEIPKDGAKYEWYVTGGTITSGNTSEAINVNWNGSGQGEVRLIITGPKNCSIDTLFKKVKIIPVPVADAGTDLSFCSGDTILIGPASPDPSLSYQWLTTAGLSQADISNPQLTLLNSTQNPAVRKYVLRTYNILCESLDTINITIFPRPQGKAITGNSKPCFDGSYPYSISHTPGSTYKWGAKGGTIENGQGTGNVTINWNSEGTGEIEVVETNVHGCAGETVRFAVDIQKIIIDTVFGTRTVCPNSRMIRYWVDDTRNSTYSWFVDRGIQTGGGNSPDIRINWGDSGFGTIKVLETTSLGCVSDTLNVPIVISYRLQTGPIMGDSLLCELTQSEPYFVSPTNGSNYTWNVSGGSFVSPNGLNHINIDWGTFGNALLSVQETSYDSVNGLPCIGDPVQKNVALKPNPLTSGISGEVALCEGQDLSYHVSGFDSSTFHWTIKDHVAFSGDGNDTITASWNSDGDYTITCIEKSFYGCEGPLKQLVIKVHPVPEITEILGEDTVCVENNQGLAYRVEGMPASTYTWWVQNGTITSRDSSAEVIIDWNEHGPGLLEVSETSDFGCQGDTISLPLVLDGAMLRMEVVTTLEDNERDIEIKWEINNDDYFNKSYRLGRSLNGSEEQSIGTFNSMTLNYIDTDVQTSETPYYYTVKTENLCNSTLLSSTHNSILLDGGKQDDAGMNLSWNGYHGWEQGVARYEIHRKLNEETSYKLYRQNVQDTVRQLDVGLDGYTQCYRIRAIENGTDQEASWSNTICGNFEPVVYIPTAFSPDGDFINDTFEVTSSNHKYISMKIYNRWGEEVFNEVGLNPAWDGFHKDKLAAEDVYIYSIEVENNRDRFNYSGTLTLIR